MVVVVVVVVVVVAVVVVIVVIVVARTSIRLLLLHIRSRRGRKVQAERPRPWRARLQSSRLGLHGAPIIIVVLIRTGEGKKGTCFVLRSFRQSGSGEICLLGTGEM